MGTAYSKRVGLRPFSQPSDAQLRRIFLHFDADHDNRLSLEEALAFLKDFALATGQPFNAASSTELFRVFDPLSIRFIDKQAFGALVRELILHPDRVATGRAKEPTNVLAPVGSDVEPLLFGTVYRTVDEAWPVLSPGIYAMFEGPEAWRQAAQQINFYDVVYKLCVLQQEAPLYERLGEAVMEVCKARYKEVAEADHDRVVTLYSRAWSTFVFGQRVLRHTTDYLHRFFLPRSSPQIVGVEELASKLWGDHVLKKCCDFLTSNICDVLDRIRAGEPSADSTAVQQSVASFLAVEAAFKASSFYRMWFEEEFLRRAESFFRRESKEWLADLPLTEYMKRASHRMDEEVARCAAIVDTQSTEKLRRVLQDAFVTAHASRLEDEFGVLLEAGKLEEMAILYKLLVPIANSVSTLRTCLGRWVARKCEEIRLAAAPLTSHAEIRKTVDVILSLIKLVSHLSDLLRVCFASSPDFKSEVDKHVKATVGEPFGKFSMPELLAFWCDATLKGRGAEFEDRDIVAGFGAVFGHIDDKDLFFGFYSRLLSRRLLSGKFDEEVERALIATLKEEFGSPSIFKLEGMLNDVELSRGVAQQFKAASAPASLGAVTDVVVLTGCAWPFVRGESDNAALPSTMRGVLDAFTGFYKKKHPSRKLAWCLGQSTAVVTLRFEQRRFELRCSAFQACALLLFDAAPELLLDDIALALHLEPAVVVSFLEPLTLGKFPVLVAVLEGAHAPRAELTRAHRLRLNEALPSLRPPRTFGVPPYGAQTAQKAAQADVQREVMTDRRVKVEAAVVRVMKARKRMSFAELLEEVGAQLQRHFHVEARTLKKALASLAEREYVQRDEHDVNIFTYAS